MQARLDEPSVAEKNTCATPYTSSAGGVNEVGPRGGLDATDRWSAQVQGSAVGRAFDVMGNPADAPPGDVLAYRMWNILRESRTAYAGRFHSSDANPGNPLDSLTWELRVELAVLLAGIGDGVLCAERPLGAASQPFGSVILIGGT